MNKLRSVSAILVGLSFATSTAGIARSVGWPIEGPITRTLSPYVASGELSGFVSVTTSGAKKPEIVVRGYADIESRRQMQPDTIFRAYSMSKPVTGVALMILFDEGKWKFDDPIAKFLPELSDLKVFHGLDADGKPKLSSPAFQPTMRQLVTHTAGFLYGFGNSYVDRRYQKDLPLIPKSISAEEYLSRLRAIPLGYEPGTQWQYSISMDLEGIIIERLSGMAFAKFLRRRVFGPLAMKDTGFTLDRAKASRVATLYEFREQGLRPVHSGAFFIDPFAPSRLNSGGGGLFTTAIDYSRFARMLLNGGTLDGRRVLSSKAAKAIMTSQLPTQLVDQGFGIGLQQIRPGFEFGVNGVVVTDPARANAPLGKGTYLWDGAATNFFWVDPEHHSTVVVFTQRLVAPPPALLIQAETQKAVNASYQFGP